MKTSLPPDRVRVVARGVGWGVAAMALFHVSYQFHALAWLSVLMPWAVMGLTVQGRPKPTFYAGLAVGLLCYGPQLGFFWGIFGPPALALWGVLAFWMGAFTATLCGVRLVFGPAAALGWGPVLWMGFEYFRSELYYLRFSWLNVGYALAWSDAAVAFRWLGVYGIGFVAALAGGIAWFASGRARWGGVLLAAALLGFARWDVADRDARPRGGGDGSSVSVAGAQVESAAMAQLPGILDALAKEYPSAQLVVLPEYTLDSEPPSELREWCRREGRYLVVGGREPLDGSRFRNTAFVIDTNGAVVFRQTKSVPIQFFSDGEPATSQALWASPWGPLGLAICYDLSYTRVIDRLVELGAVGLIIPTMDAAIWGAHQHALHARVAPVRAREYGLPVLRVASSGVSQIVRADGRVTASAPFSEEVRTFGGTLELRGPGGLPFDRWLAPFASWLALATPFVILLRQRVRSRPDRETRSTPISP